MLLKQQDIERLQMRIKQLESFTGQHLQIEETLLASEKKYKTIFENTGSAMILIEEDTTISMVNTEFEKLTGYDRKTIERKMSWKHFIAEEYLNRMVRYHYQRRKNPALAPRNYECRLLRKDGRLRTCHMTVALIPDTSQSVASLIDITERIEAEDALRVSEQKFSKAFHASPVAITISVLKDGRFIEVNESFLQITGYKDDEVIGHTTLEISLWPTPEYRKELIKKILKPRQSRFHEIFFRVKSGEIRNGIYSGELIHLQGEPHLISIFADITKQRQLEKEILNIGERERQKIGQELHDDLQQHLIGIEALTKLLGNRLEQKSVPESALVKEMVDLIRSAITKTRTLSRGLCPLDMHEDGLCAGIRALASRMHDIFGVTCQLKVSNKLTIKDDYVGIHLYRIIQESVNNAIRHGKARQILITLTLRNKSICAMIADDGLGIGEDRSSSGGLGLKIMKYRASMIGADLVIQNNPKGGTIVTCMLK